MKKQAGNIVNEYMQRAGDCVDFDWSANAPLGNCQLYDDWQTEINPCVVCKGQFCLEFKESK